MRILWSSTGIAVVVLLLSTQTAVSHPEIADSSYFPLSIGEQWSYSGTSGLIQLISDTARVNGYLFYGRALKGYPPSEWFRISNDSLFVIRSLNDTNEVLLYRFGAEVGDTIWLPSAYDCTYGEMVILAGKDDTVSTPSGTYFHCYHYKYVSFCADAGMLDSWLAEGIGTVKFKQESFVGLQTFSLDSIGIATPPSSQDLLQYYPLQTGDYWEYKVDSHDECGFPVLCEDTSAYSVEALGDTVLPNRIHYEVLLFRSFYPIKDTSYLFERVDSSSGCVFQYDTGSTSKEYQVDSLFAAPGDTFLTVPKALSYGPRPFKGACSYIAEATILGTQTQAEYFEEYPPVIDAEGEYLYTLAGGFGLYYFYDSWFDGYSNTRLVYAKINGIEYGTKILLGIADRRPPPVVFSLSQNYPNPFNPATVISYQLPVVSRVTLKVFDIRGREIATLVDGRESAGYHEVKFDGSRLPSGVYFVRLTAGSFSATRKIMLMK
ncbi:MAG TPA: T9SS type A sorting domain-containing protein [Candidatus Kryptonia bacterium]